MVDPRTAQGSDTDLTLSDVAKLIVDFGIVDVDFPALSRHYNIPEEKLNAATGGSLLAAIQVAMDTISLSIKWPVFIPDWREFLHKNTMNIWDLFASHPGYARLTTSGVMSDVPQKRNMNYVLMLKRLGFPSHSIPILLTSTVVAMLSERTQADTLSTEYGNIVELYSEYLIEPTEKGLLDTPYTIAFKQILKNTDFLVEQGIPLEEIQLTRELVNKFYSTLVHDQRGWFEEHLKLTLDGLETRYEALLDAGKTPTNSTTADAPPTMNTEHRDALATQAPSGDATLDDPYVDDYIPPVPSLYRGMTPQSIDDVAQLVTEFGFLDVDFNRLSRHFHIPVKSLVEAADGSLFKAVSRAMDLKLRELQWPVATDTWQEFIELNSLKAWDFFSANPGYARLFSNGITGVDTITKIRSFALNLQNFGIDIINTLFILSASVIPAVNEWADNEASMTDTGNVAEIVDEMSKTTGTSYEQFYLYYQKLIRELCEESDFPMTPEEVMISLGDVMQSHFDTNPAKARDSYRERIRVTIAGLETRMANTKDGRLF